MVKVALVTPWGKGVRCGIRTYSENLAYALAENGVDVFVIKWPRFGLKVPELIQSMCVDKIPVDRVDIVHVENEYGLFYYNLTTPFYTALSRLGKPIVTTVHAVGNPVLDGIVSRFSSRVIVHNEWCAKNFNGPSVIIPHGCKPSSTPPIDECKKALGIDPKIPVVGYLGFISPNKGIEMLIEAMRKVETAGLLIAGGWFTEEEVEYINELKRRSLEGLPGRCMWTGYVEDERMASVYGAMDVFVYPARQATESGALLNALSHGRATIASNIPPFREKDKYLLTFSNVDDLAEKIKNVLENDELRRGLEEAARKYAEENSWKRVAKLHADLYSSLVSATHG